MSEQNKTTIGRDASLAALEPHGGPSELIVPTTAVVEPVKRGRGRPKGSRNKVSKEAQTFFRRLLRDSTFRKNYRQKFIGCKLEAQQYSNAFAYAWGKPVDQISMEGVAPTAAFMGPVTIVVNGKTYRSGDGEPSGS